jgi:hypothetical protein
MMDIDIDHLDNYFLDFVASNSSQDHLIQMNEIGRIREIVFPSVEKLYGPFRIFYG